MPADCSTFKSSDTRSKIRRKTSDGTMNWLHRRKRFRSLLSITFIGKRIIFVVRS